MDEEDLQELKDSRNMVDTTDEMDLTGGRGADFEESEKECVTISDCSCHYTHLITLIQFFCNCS
jgi:hypothetical protein